MDANYTAELYGRRIVSTRLAPPQRFRTPLHRQRLYQKIALGAKGALTTVVAPAGYGKSTLLALWAAQSGVAVSWLRADQHDQEFSSFLAHLVHAIAVWPEEARHRCADRLWSLAGLDNDARLSHSVSELIEQMQAIREEIILVIDEYDRVRNPDIHAAMSRLVSLSPPHVHFIVAGRTALPFVRGSVMEWDYVSIDSGELAMTQQEAASYLLKHDGIHVNEEELQDVWARTHGWMTGINVVVSLVRQHGAYPLGETSFAVQLDARLADYFSTHVMAGIPETIQSRLLRLSIPDEIDHSLYAELCGSQIPPLSVCASDGLFLTELSGRQGVYKIHPLFRRYLRYQFRQAEPESYIAINRICMHRFEQRGDYVEAARCALHITDIPAAAAIIAGHPAELLRDENLPLLELLSQFPASEWEHYPLLAWLYAEALIHARLYTKAEHMLEIAQSSIADREQILLPSTGEPLTAYMDSDRSRIHFIRNEPEAGFDYMLKTAAALGGSGKLHGMLYFHPSTVSLLNSPYGFWGVLPSAKLTTDFCEPRWSKRDLGYGAVVVIAGECYWECGEWEKADRFLNKGLHLGLELEEPALVISASYALAKLAWSRQDKASAYAVLQECREHLIRLNKKERLALLDACEADFRIRDGHLKPVRRWLSERAISPDRPIDPYRMFEHLVLLRSQFALGKTAQVRSYGQRVLRAAETNHFPYHIVEVRMILARVDQMLGDQELALEKAASALRIAHDHQYLQLFALEGSSYVRLLQDFVKSRKRTADKTLIDYAKKIMKLLPVYSEHAALSDDITAGLTKQEIRVCKWIADGLTNKAIAQNLGISEETVKKHCQSIYRKLGVKNRREIGKLTLPN